MFPGKLHGTNRLRPTAPARPFSRGGGARFEIALLATAALLAALAESASGGTLSNLTAYRVEYVVTVSNVDASMTALELYVPSPVDWVCQRRTAVEALTPGSADVDRDEHGNGICSWSIDSPPGPGETMEFTQVFTYWAYDETIIVDPGSIPPYDTGSWLYQTYTAHEDKIEADAPEIQAAAAAIVGAETNPYEKAALIYEWVMDHMTYVTYDGFRGALASFHDGWGECGDYSTLFCALLRAVDVPARPCVGLNAETGPSCHVWAEYYLPDAGWVPVDPAWDDGNAVWQYFGSVPCSDRLVCSKNCNIELSSGRVTSLFQTFSWWWSGSGGEVDCDLVVTFTEIDPSTASAFRVEPGGDVLADRTVFAASFATGAADIAEWVAVSEPVEPGTVVELDPSRPTSYRASRSACSSRIAGVISAAPGVLLGAEGRASEAALLALVGIVPAWVTGEGGPIRPGDLLVASSTAGHAMRWDGSDPCRCALVGKALEPMADERGRILVLLTAH